MLKHTLVRPRNNYHSNNALNERNRKVDATLTIRGSSRTTCSYWCETSLSQERDLLDRNNGEKNTLKEYAHTNVVNYFKALKSFLAIAFGFKQLSGYNAMAKYCVNKRREFL